MKRKLLCAVAWLGTLLLVAWLGCAFGVRLGRAFCQSNYRDYYLRTMRADLADAKDGSDERTALVLDAVSEFVGAVGDSSDYAKARAEFAETIKELQNRSVELTGTAPRSP